MKHGEQVAAGGGVRDGGEVSIILGGDHCVIEARAITVRAITVRPITVRAITVRIWQ